MAGLTDSDTANRTELKTEKLLEDTGNTYKTQTSNKQDFNLEKSSSRDPRVFALQQDNGNLKPKRSRSDSQTQHQKQTDEAHHHTPTVELRRLPFLETHVTELKTLRCSVYLTKDCTQMSLQPRELDKQQVNSDGFTSTQLNAKTCLHLQSPADSPCSDERSSVATSGEHITRVKMDGFCSSMLIPSPTSLSSCQDKAQGVFQKEVHCSSLGQLELDQADSRQSGLPNHSPPDAPATGTNTSEPFDVDSLSHTRPASHNIMRQVDPTPTSDLKPAEWQSEVVKADETSNSSDHSHCGVPSESPLSVPKTEDMDDGSCTGTYGGDLGLDSQVSFLWQDGRDGEESRFDVDFRLASREDRHFVCPVTLRKIMSGPAQALVSDTSPDVCCRFLHLFICPH